MRYYQFSKQIAEAPAQSRASSALASVMDKIAGFRAVTAAVFGLGLCMGMIAAPALRAEGIFTWAGGTTGTWDTTGTTSWTTQSGTDVALAAFSNSSAVVFTATGTAASEQGGTITISSSGVILAAQPTLSGTDVTGTNPGMIVQSGSWYFTGGEITGGAIQVTGSSTLAFEGVNTTGSRAMNQRIMVDDTQSLTLVANQTMLGFDNALELTTGNGRAISTGTDSDLTLTVSGTSGSVMTFSRNVVSGSGGAIYSGGDLTITGSGLTTRFFNNSAGGTGNAAHYASAVYAQKKFTLSDHAALVGEGGFAAQSFDFTDAILVSHYDGNYATNRFVFTTIDADGNPVATSGSIVFTNMTISGSFGMLNTNPGSDITFSGSNTIAVPNSYTGTNFGSSLFTKFTIAADITGTGAITKVDTGVLILTGTNNTHSGTFTVSGGMLVGNVSGSSALVIESGATYRSGTSASTAKDRDLFSLAGSGTVDTQGKNLTVRTGDFGGGIILNSGTLLTTSSVTITGSTETVEGSGTFVLNTSTAFITTALFTTSTLFKESNTVFTIGNAKVSDLVLNEGALIVAPDKQLNISGTAALAASTTLGVHVGTTPSVVAGGITTGGLTTVINIAGYGGITQHAGTSEEYVIVSSTGGPISGTYTLTIADVAISSVMTSTSQFMLVNDVSTGSNIKVTTQLVWESTAPASAHGTFQINSGSFLLGANLGDNAAALSGGAASFAGWDGQSLTKIGSGALVLSGTNTYTGTTSVLEGTLVNRGAIIGSGGNAGPVNVASGATFINSGTLAADTNNAGLFVFASLATTSTFTDTTSGTTTISTTTTYSNGTIGNVYNTGTVVLEMNADYSYTGTFTGSGGLLRKTGSSAFTFNGGFSHTGDISVENGMLAAGKAHQFDTVANINITGSSSVLSLGGHDHALKNVVITDGALRFGPNQPTTGAPYADYANVTLQTLTGSSGVIIMRTDYGAISNGVTGTGGRPMGDRLTISGSASGDYRVIVSNRDSQTPQKLTAGHKLIIVQSGSDIATATFSGTAESGIGLLIITRGDAQSTIFSDTNAWYLSDSNKLTNTADSLLSTASAAGLEWAYLLDSVRQRMGDLRQESLMMPPQTKQSPLAYTTVTSAGGNFWLHGNTYRLDATNDITGTAFDEDVGGVSLGGDKTYRWEDNQYLLGAYLTLSHISRDFSARGDNTTNTRGVGLYFTYLKDNGWYGDTTFLITGNKNKITAYSVDGFTNTAEYSTVSWGLSVEVGRLLMNKRTGWWLEPSGQIAYARLGGDSYTTSNDIDVQYDPANFTQYRIQLRAGRDLPGSSLKPYVKAGLVAVTTSSGRMRAGDRYFRPDMDGTRVEAGVGMSYTFDEKSQFYLDYEYAKADSYTRPWAFSFGYRRTW